MEEKIFKKFDEQIEGLKCKNLNFKNEEFALKVLQKVNYYSLINGYKSIFLDKNIDEKYRENTFFEDIYYLYSFDAEMREVLLKFIFKFENNIKTKIIYYFSEKFKNDNEAYLNKNNFDYNNHSLKETIDKLVLKIENIIKKQKNIRGSRINHYSQKYLNIPLWVVMPQLDFGTTSYFYKCCTKDIQSRIAKHFYNDFVRNYPNKNEKFIITPESFSKILFFVNSFRNISAHNERLYNHSFLNENIKTTILHDYLNIKFKYRIFDLILILKSFLELSLDEEELLKKSLILSFSKLENNIGKVRFIKVLKEMRFPKNWKEIFELEEEYNKFQFEI